MIYFKWYAFSELTPRLVYDILALRAAVFVEQQGSAYLDPDGKDLSCWHLIGRENDQLVAYLRLLPPTTEKRAVTFGRVATAEHARGKGYGREMMRSLLAYAHDHYPCVTIKCSAQQYLKDFYESFGFVAEGEPYEEVGVWHISMSREG